MISIEDYSNKNVKAAGSAGFAALYKIARGGVKKHWRKMSTADRMDAARSLVYIRDVERNPDKYLARAYTQKAWCGRAKEYADAHGINTFKAYYIVPTPSSIVTEHATEALRHTPGLWADFYNFTNNVSQYDYHLTNNEEYSVMTDIMAKCILIGTKRLTDRAQAASAHPTIRWIYKLRNQLRQY